MIFIILWQAGRLIPGLDKMPYLALIASSLLAGGIALFTMLPAMAEIAASNYKPRNLLIAGFICLALFGLTAVISRATYNEFEGLLAFNSLLLIGVTTCLGIWLSTEIEKVGHLLPVCIIAAGVDIISVAKGPSSVVVKQITEHMQSVAAGIIHLPPFTSFLILRYPQAGSGLAMMLGAGDLAFFAILAGVVVRTGLPRINIPLIALWGFIAVLVSHIFQAAIPALPFIGVGFVITNIRWIKLDRTEWLITIGVSIFLIALGVILALKLI